MQTALIIGAVALVFVALAWLAVKTMRKDSAAIAVANKEVEDAEKALERAKIVATRVERDDIVKRMQDGEF